MSDGGAVSPTVGVLSPGGGIVAAALSPGDSGATVAIMLESLDATAVGAIVSVVELELELEEEEARRIFGARCTFFGGSGSMPNTS